MSDPDQKFPDPASFLSTLKQLAETVSSQEVALNRAREARDHAMRERDMYEGWYKNERKRTEGLLKKNRTLRKKLKEMQAAQVTEAPPELEEAS